jgi:GxxExxY protein
MIRTYSNLDSTTEQYITEVIDCGFAVHKDVGPGYMEPLYSNALCIELRARGIPFERERVVTVKYRDEPVGIHRLDFVVRGCIVLELKAAKALEPVHQAQLMAYMKASKIRVGLLMNFCGATFKEGTKRVVL